MSTVSNACAKSNRCAAAKVASTTVIAVATVLFSPAAPAQQASAARRSPVRIQRSYRLDGVGWDGFIAPTLRRVNTDHRLLDTPGGRAEPLDNDRDRHRQMVIGLYALGTSLVGQSMVLVDTGGNHKLGVRAEFVPAWMNGLPAARFRLTF